MKHLAILAIILATMCPTVWAAMPYVGCDNSTPHNCE